MNNTDFDELAGRIQALTDFVLHLTSALEINQIIDGAHLSETLNRFADGRRFAGSHLESTRRTLHELTQFLDEARMRRQ
jgi:hypothetical protein